MIAALFFISPGNEGSGREGEKEEEDEWEGRGTEEENKGRWGQERGEGRL